MLTESEWSEIVGDFKLENMKKQICLIMKKEMKTEPMKWDLIWPSWQSYRAEAEQPDECKKGSFIIRTRFFLSPVCVSQHFSIF